jgi:hypothetical protein
MINRAQLRVIIADLEVAIAPVAKKHGLVAEIGGGSFTEDFFRPRVTLKEPTSDKAAFEKWADRFGLKTTDFGRKFSVRGRTYTVDGVKPSAARAILTTASDGRKYAWPPHHVKQLLETSPCP